MFEKVGIPLQNRVRFQGSDEIGSNIVVECGFKVTKGSSAGSKQEPQTPF